VHSSLLVVVPSATLDRDDHLILGAYAAGEPAVWAEPASVRFDLPLT
jgi:hypothetical protein